MCKKNSAKILQNCEFAHFAQNLATLCKNKHKSVLTPPLIKSNLFCWCCKTCGQNKRHSRELPGGAHIIHISRGRSWGKIKSVRESQFSNISNRWHGAEVPLRLKFSPKEKLCKSLLDQSRLADVSLKLKEILARIVLKIWPERRLGLFLRKKKQEQGAPTIYWTKNVSEESMKGNNILAQEELHANAMQCIDP